MYIFIAVAIIIVATALWWINDQHSLPPGPWDLPLLGFLPWLDPEHPYETLTSLAKKYGTIYTFNLGTVRTIVLSDHKIVKQAFMKDALSGRAPLYVTHGIMKGHGM
ncbi:cytochrome P450 306a1-like [Agrilus planipennis]|uniref:Cytochrome P450 306a1-like n=1 Tax=Agrilus planipennis TaxID=224129 RepID=A0A7F5RCV7_AGRPL|nr:cytochrome P450 306a1-like [Agrilus planipennis]XP_025833781.1 cytochrome P450 306a1-like [Agrilus planipennis]XP_025833782.1 cytochrome P450 306a1-like [Agrilus planipennis]